VPVARQRTESPDQFCCGGCEAAHRVIHACGLQNYYRVLEPDRHKPGQPNPTRRAYAEYDTAAFGALYCREAPGALRRTELVLEGVHCAGCLWLLERLPKVVPGVVEARLDLRRASLHVTFDPAVVPLSRIAQALDTLGYPPHPARGVVARDARRVEDRRMLVRIAIAGACAGNIMLLFFALYAGMFEGIEPQYEQLFRWIAMLLNTLCLAWPALPFARSAVAALRTRTVHLDVPIAMGLYLGGAWGIWKTIAGSGDLYFDSISALVFFLLIGRYVQQRQQRSAADAMELLFALSPTTAHRLGPDGTTSEVPIEALSPGDVVEVRAGDSAPADGVILAGESKADLSLLSGESRPVRIRVGESLAAGSVNLESPIRMRVDATGEATRIGRLMTLVEEAARRRAAIVRLADRWGAWLLWVLLALALATLALWWHAGPAVAIDRAAALLIATCPCGLGLATPLAMTVAIGRAARLGMLIKGGDALESLARAQRAGVMILDKTGTLTQGRLELIDWQGDAYARPFVAALESHAAHPSARALCRSLQSDPDLSAVDVRVLQGLGIEGTVAGRRITVGSQRLMHELGVTVPASLHRAAAATLDAGHSPVFVCMDGACVALASLGDPVRPEAAESLRTLRRMGWEIRILSGDHPDLVASIARSLGVEPGAAQGAVSPEAKLLAVRELTQHRPVVFVGDGVNDAAALAAASVGIAVRGGAEASVAAADIALTRDGIAPLVDLCRGARRTTRTIHLTIATSLAYNALAAALCMSGLISPLLAAIIMPASSFTVVALCLRSGAFARRTESTR